MHLRFSTCIGTPVLEEGFEHTVGLLSGILIHPDTGKIEGFLVHVLGAGDLFMSSLDVSRWGTRIYIRSTDVLSPAEDRIRLQPLLDDPRSILGQKIRTESGTSLGRCQDIQFNTDVMHVEWLFPRKWFHFGVALPISDVVEVTPAAIIVKDPVVKAEAESQELEEVPTALPEIETPRLG